MTSGLDRPQSRCVHTLLAGRSCTLNYETGTIPGLMASAILGPREFRAVKSTGLSPRYSNVPHPHFSCLQILQILIYTRLSTDDRRTAACQGDPLQVPLDCFNPVADLSHVSDRTLHAYIQVSSTSNVCRLSSWCI